jgi:hypothetical protein
MVGSAMNRKKRKSKAKSAPPPKDIFDPKSQHRRPFVRIDGTIEWPRGWTKSEAKAWRKANQWVCGS